MKDSKNILLNGICLLVGLVAVMRFVTVPAESVEGYLRDRPCAENPKGTLQGVPCAAVLAASESYDRRIRGILQPKCYDCHGVVARIPLYAKVPPVSMLVEEDIEHAKKDFNMSAGFPFTGKKDFLEDLHELEEVVEDGEMPPLVYKTMHWKSGLTAEEKEKVLAWARNTRAALTALRSASQSRTP
jgi:hypothetical protein